MENIQWLSDKVILEKIGSKTKEWRLELNLTQKELAQQAEISLITVQQIEYGKGASLTLFLRVLRILGHLDLFEEVIQEHYISPIEYQKLQDGQRPRQRASKKKNDDTDADSAPLW